MSAEISTPSRRRALSRYISVLLRNKYNVFLFPLGQPWRCMPSSETVFRRKQGFMLISDIFRREESQIDSLSADFEPRDNDDVDDRKIINFVPAKAGKARIVPFG